MLQYPFTLVKLMMLSLPLSGPLKSQPFLAMLDTKPLVRVSCAGSGNNFALHVPVVRIYSLPVDILQYLKTQQRKLCQLSSPKSQRICTDLSGQNECLICRHSECFVKAFRYMVPCYLFSTRSHTVLMNQSFMQIFITSAVLRHLQKKSVLQPFL